MGLYSFVLGSIYTFRYINRNSFLLNMGRIAPTIIAFSYKLMVLIEEKHLMFDLSYYTDILTKR